MKENNSLCDDLELLKDFEELKLKQKILIETLKKKNEGKLTLLLSNINAKLDFLVKIFQEVKNDDSSQQMEDNIIDKINKLNEKIESLNSSVESLKQDFQKKVEEDKKANEIESFDNFKKDLNENKDKSLEQTTEINKEYKKTIP